MMVMWSEIKNYSRIDSKEVMDGENVSALQAGKAVADGLIYAAIDERGAKMLRLEQQLEEVMKQL